MLASEHHLDHHRFCVAPMMGRTDRHFRYLLRLMSQRAMLYTEMIVCDALLFGNRDRLLKFSPSEHPLGLQLGGSEPAKMAEATQWAQDYGYDEININAGCPSSRVQAGAFGAYLMKEPGRVAECVSAMRQQTTIPITVKCRVGVDDQDSYSDLHSFISTVMSAGCQTFIIHARKAWLKGLSPKQNRNVPELRYDLVYQLKHDFPELNIILNGGLATIAEAQSKGRELDGVMLGRAIYQNPLIMLEVDAAFYGESQNSRVTQEVLTEYFAYINDQTTVPLRLLLRHLANFYRSKPGAKRWRQFWNDAMLGQDQLPVSVIEQARQFSL